VAEDDGRAGFVAPVFVVDLGVVGGCDVRHFGKGEGFL